MPKQVNLGGELTFGSINDAMKYFDAIRKDRPLGSPLRNADFEAVRRLYEAYCFATDWPLKEIRSIFTKETVRHGGATTCFCAEFADDSQTEFSLSKALRAIAV